METCEGFFGFRLVSKLKDSDKLLFKDGYYPHDAFSFSLSILLLSLVYAFFMRKEAVNKQVTTYPNSKRLHMDTLWQCEHAGPRKKPTQKNKSKSN